MPDERESDESERDFEEVHGEEGEFPRDDERRAEDSEVDEGGAQSGLEEIGEIDEVGGGEASTTADEPRERGGRPDRQGQPGRSRGDRGDRGGRGPRGRGDRRRDRDQDRGRGPQGPQRPPAPAPEGAREGARDLSRAGRHEPTADEILPPEEGAEPTPRPEDDDEGREWALLEEFEGNGGGEQRGRRRDRGNRQDPRSDVDELGAATGIDVLEAPREDRGRRRGLEPGLSLRDLMPFLRPPRNLVVAGVSTGAGHLRVARVVFEGLKALDRNLTPRDVDLLEHVAPAFKPAYVRAVLEDIQRRPGLFGIPLETQPPSAAEMMPADFDEFLKSVFDEKLERALFDRRPEWLVLSHWLPFRWLEARAAADAPIPRIAAICPDPDYHEWWYSPVVKAWLVSNAAFSERLVARGVDPESVQVVGVPVHPQFRAPVARDAVARGLSLKKDQPTVLLRPGGVGPAERSVALVKRLLELPLPMNLLVVAGKNDRLREELEKLGPSSRSVLRPFGFVDNIHELMAVSDVMVTRATPHTLAEAAAAGVPLVLLRPTPGVEERASDRLVAEGSAVVARDESALESELGDLLRNRRRLRFMHERAIELAQLDGRQNAIDRLTKLMR
jgi:processive 1,2-diacylglycerol beta-glucosyltransferase